MTYLDVKSGGKVMKPAKQGLISINGSTVKDGKNTFNFKQTNREVEGGDELNSRKLITYKSSLLNLDKPLDTNESLKSLTRVRMNSLPRYEIETDTRKDFVKETAGFKVPQLRINTDDL